MTPGTDYSLFYQFIEKYQADGFHNIDRADAFLAGLEKRLKKSRQFFFIADLIQLKIRFTSSGSTDLLGIEPEAVDPSTFYTMTHPDDLTRHNLGRTKLFNLGQEMFITGQKQAVLSTNFRFVQASGHVVNLLIQCYLFYSDMPYRTVFLLQVVTDISHFRLPDYGYHYNLSDNPADFRFPDSRLLKTGNLFSRREYEIISLIARGYNSKQVAEKLFLSVHTVNTHRRNILAKTGYPGTQQLILDLKVRGVI